MITRRKLLLALGASTLATDLPAYAQAPKIRRIGFLAARSRSILANPEPYYEAFEQGMGKFGYVEGRTIAIEWRYADGDYARLPGLAAELVRLNVEVLVTHGSAATQIAQKATRTIPIVFAAANDPVGSGLAASLARPGGNITGLAISSIDVSPKHLELLKTLLPKLARIAFLANPDNSSHAAILKSVQAAARTIGVKVLAVEARKAEDFESAFAKMVQEKSQALIIAADAFYIGLGRQLAAIALKKRMPAIFPYREQVAAGGLMSYGQDLANHYRLAAAYVDKILKGAKPGDLPIEQPSGIHLALNRKTAKALGLAIPQEFLLRADEVIE